MGWSLNQVQPSGTSGAQGVAGVDGATVLIDNSGANDPATNGFILDTQPFKRIIINSQTFRLYELDAGLSGSNSGNYTDHGEFAGDDGTDGAGYSGASYDAGTGQVTFTGSGGNTDVVTGDLRGADGANGTTPEYLTGTGAPTDSVTGEDGDVYVDTDTGDFYGPRTSGAWGTSSLNIKGSDGVDVTTASASTGDLIITLSDATEINAGSVAGADGDTVTFEIGTVTTLSAGSSAIVEFDSTSTDTNKVLNFSIPQGAVGATGADGTDGQSVEQQTEVTQETGNVGDLFASSGTLYQKRREAHVSEVNISLADFTPDDTTLNPNGTYVFTSFTVDSNGNEYARYILENNDGGVSPDYIIEWDEAEGEWELYANTEPRPSPLLQNKPTATDDLECQFYPVEENWKLNITNYPTSTAGIVTQQSTAEEYIEYETQEAFIGGSSTNQSDKIAISVPDLVGYVKGVPYFEDFHTMDGGQKMTGASHSDSSQNITADTDLTYNFKLDKIRIKTNKECDFIVYGKTGTGIVVTDDENVGLGSEYLGLYSLESSTHNGKKSWKNSDNNYISWDGSAWAIRATEDGASVRQLTTSDIEDPSTLTQQESNLVNVYPERRTLTFDAFGTEADVSHTNTGVGDDDIIKLGGSIDGLISTIDLTTLSTYPEIFVQLLSKDEDVELTVSAVRYKVPKECWKNILATEGEVTNTFGSLVNVNSNIDSPQYDRSMVVWSVEEQAWVLSAFNNTSWYNGETNPSDDTGLEGDYFINNFTKDIFRKVNNTWVQQFNTASGADGVGIESVEENDGSVDGKPQYSLTFTFTDDTTFTTSALKGATGANGSAGGLPTGGDSKPTGSGLGTVPWTPTETSSNFLWVDSTKTASIAKSGSDVVTWSDAYAQGNSLVKVDTSTIAIESYTGDDDGASAVDVIAIDAVTDRMTTSTNFGTTDSDFFVCGVFEIREDAQGVIFDVGNGATTGSFVIEMSGADDLELNVITNDNTPLNHNLDTDTAVGDKFLVTINARESDYTVRVNGEEIAVQSSNIRGAVNAKQTSIGDPDGADSLLSRHCEWVFGSEHLTDANIQLLEGYLAHKWEITGVLPSTHDHKTVEPEKESGSYGQILAKTGDGDYEVAWVDPTPYNKFVDTGVGDEFEVLTSHHGATVLVADRARTVDVILPYNPADGWQCFFIHRNGNFPVRFLAKASGGETNIIIPDAGWASDGEDSSTCFLKTQGDSCSCTWDKTRGKWYVQGNVRTYADTYDLDGIGISGSNSGGY